MFDERGATFYPIAVIAVGNAIDVFDLSVMDVSTNHSVGLLIFGESRHFFFII